MKNILISSASILLINICIVACKKEPSSYELLQGRWLAKNSVIKETDNTSGSGVIKDTTIYFTNQEYLNFLSDGKVIYHAGNDVYDTSTYAINGNNLTIFSRHSTGGVTLYDTSFVTVQTLTESSLILYEKEMLSANKFQESTFKLER